MKHSGRTIIFSVCVFAVNMYSEKSFGRLQSEVVLAFDNNFFCMY